MQKQTIHQDAFISAPFGSIILSLNQQGRLARIDLSPERHTAISSSRTKQVAQAIQSYLAQACSLAEMGEQILNLLEQGSPFQRRVWHAINTIPLGQVLTYQMLADRVGSGARAVANACGANPLPLFIPCHRVVASNGLGGFMQGVSGGLAIKQWLLQHEGVSDGYRVAGR